MSFLDAELVETIKIVGSLYKQGDFDAASELGKKVLSSLTNGKDSLLFNLCYDLSLVKTSDVTTLINLAYLEKLSEKAYNKFKEVTAGARADYWFKNGSNNPSLQRFFVFLARKERYYDVKADSAIFTNLIKALSNKDTTYSMPSSLSSFGLERFLTALTTGEIRIDGGGIR